MSMQEQDAIFLRRAIALAQENRRRGFDPFGAVLVYEGHIAHEDYDRSVERSDPTCHAELGVISEYCRVQKLFSLEGYTLYSSTEPCLMCTGAIHWSRLSRMVFSVSQAQLQQFSGGRTKPTCVSFLNSNQVNVVGPLLSDEGLVVFEGYHFSRRREQHRRLFGTT